MKLTKESDIPGIYYWEIDLGTSLNYVETQSLKDWCREYLIGEVTNVDIHRRNWIYKESSWNSTFQFTNYNDALMFILRCDIHDSK